jgi:hypothetical protein
MYMSVLFVLHQSSPAASRAPTSRSNLSLVLIFKGVFSSRKILALATDHFRLYLSISVQS